MDVKRRVGWLLAGTVLGTSILISVPAFADDAQLQQQINAMLQLLLHRIDLLLQLSVIGEGGYGNQDGCPEYRPSQQPPHSSFDVHRQPPTCNNRLSLTAINPVPVYFSCVTLG